MNLLLISKLDANPFLQVQVCLEPINTASFQFLLNSNLPPNPTVTLFLPLFHETPMLSLGA